MRDKYRVYARTIQAKFLRGPVFGSAPNAIVSQGRTLHDKQIQIGSAIPIAARPRTAENDIFCFAARERALRNANRPRVWMSLLSFAHTTLNAH